uniref:Cysteine protease n=1 Tax=Plectus sambesii TaxID=2011161 RepID=A0A914X332_9BILA
MLETCVTMEPGYYEFEDHAFFEIDDPVFILGREFNAKQDLEEIKHFIRSRLWFTYRKNFMPIGGTGPVSDQGWGCMLRCGQMLLAQSLIVRHLGREWIWDRDHKERVYWNILRLFQDKKSCMYSLHQIAQMGVSERKEVGEWFGPNTAAQVLKKLAIYDEWSRLAVHVAMDNLVIEQDVKLLCKSQPRPRRRTDSEHLEGATASASASLTIPEGCCSAASINSDLSPAPSTVSTDAPSAAPTETPSNNWRPLLLIVPLRLGLTEMNMCYLKAIKEYFALPHCVGIIGGRPNHALYFLGVVGDELLYLDPHECQPAVDLDEDESDDSSYHCPFLLHMPFDRVDPSLALGFLCMNESEFDELASRLRTKLLKSSNPPLFELVDARPKSWPKFVPYLGEDDPTARIKEFTVVGDAQFDSEEEFELLQ